MTYKTHDGIITSPGKFEGERDYVPMLWQQSLDSGETPDEYDVYVLVLDDTDRSQFEDMEALDEVALYEDEQGFVHELSDYNPYMVELGMDSLNH